jgi:tRNA (mo5U34)-methyltransferase
MDLAQYYQQGGRYLNPLSISAKAIEIREQLFSKIALAAQEFASIITEPLSIEPSYKSYSENSVTIGRAEDLNGQEHAKLFEILKSFVPWKKGPFNLFGEYIDAEWRSDLKWERIKPHIDLEDKVVLDIGCNNGYFMYRMLTLAPKLVIGFEPLAKHWFTFQFLQCLAREPRLKFELLGVEHANLFAKTFDTVFCLGILYHQTDPIACLRKIYHSLKPGGQLIVDCQGIPGYEPLALFPKSKYAGASGIYWLPTETTLTAWLRRSGFHKVEVFFSEKLLTSEQRRTDWAPIDSLVDFLDKNDPDKTIEGYPAPHRFYVSARR